MELLIRILDAIAEYGNSIEAGLWILIGVCFLASMVRPTHRTVKAIATLNFILFGLSDIVETQTGAWWRPWWLLAWKACCIAVMAFQLLIYIRRKKNSKA